MVAVSLGMAGCNDPGSTGASPVLQAAGSKTPGSTTDPAPTAGCKESTDANGVPCKICWDSSGSTYYDGCDTAGAGTGLGGTGGSSATEVKCLPTTDPSTGAACKTCYAADGSFTSTCAPPPSPGCVDAFGKNSCGTGGSGGTGGSVGTDVKCIQTTDASGLACKTCYAADGSISSNSCSTGGSGGVGGTGGSGGTDVKCIQSTDATGAVCKTCYAADGSIAFNTCSTGGTGASCIGAPNMETGQICKVCSDTASGKVLFVDCGAVVCGSTSSSVPPSK
jgi:hypothetical protein